MITLVGVIGTRLDVYSTIYCGWLCYFYNRERSDMFRVWKYFIVSIAVQIPLQYVLAVGIPPTYCKGQYFAYKNVSFKFVIIILAH